MNKHQFQAVSSAFLALLLSLALWTVAIRTFPMPPVPAYVVRAVDSALRDFFNVHTAHEAVLPLSVLEVRIASTVQRVESSTRQMHIEASVTSKAQGFPAAPVSPTQPQAPVADYEDELSVVDEGMDTEFSQWELTHVWNIAIPAIGIRAPVIVPSMKYWSRQAWELLEKQMQVGLRYGAVAYPHSVGPGEKGSLIIAGHSSPPDAMAKQSAYGNLFAKLPDIEIGEEISVSERGSPVSYRVVKKFIVSPKETAILAQQYDERILKLITCYPVGTTRDRMVILAEMQ